MFILVRYGDWVNNSLTELGKQQMEAAANKLKPLVNHQVLVVSGDIQRAVESAEIIAKSFGQSNVGIYSELYAAEEEGRLPEPERAYDLLASLSDRSAVVVAVVSREYIESLPIYVATKVFEKKLVDVAEIKLDRGEALLIDTENQTIKRID